MDKKRKVLLLIGLIMLVFVFFIGGTYAIYSYSKVGKNSQLVVGDIYMHYKETNELTIENALPSATYDENAYFEFTIEGKNTYDKKDIWFDILLNKGEDHETRTERIKDNLLKFTLIEIKDGQETVVVDGKSYDEIKNTRIYVSMIPRATNNQVRITYRLYMWISPETVIGNQNSDYTLDTWNNLVYGSIKVSVTGDFNKKNLNPTITEKLKENASSSGLVAINTDGNLYHAENAEEVIREYRFSGVSVKNYVKFNGEIWRIIGIFKDEEGADTLKIIRNASLLSGAIPDTFTTKDMSYTLKSSTASNYVYWNKPAGEFTGTYNDWSKSGVMHYLNDAVDVNGNKGYYSSLTDEAKSMIKETKYYYGGASYKQSLSNAYPMERNEEKTWVGNVALVNVSDYLYSADSSYWGTTMNTYATASSTSWLQNANHIYYEWTLTPSSLVASMALAWNSTGTIIQGLVSSSLYEIRPVVTLSSSVFFSGGEGTYGKPYTLSIE